MSVSFVKLHILLYSTVGIFSQVLKYYDFETETMEAANIIKDCSVYGNFVPFKRF